MPQGAIHYDNAGNLDTDYNGHTFSYDAENHQTKYDNGASVAGGATYAYDGDGRRVKKVTGGSLRTTILVYDALGQMVAEYDTATPSGSGGTSYLTSDNLGTPRVITDQSGNVQSRHDYAPFGEELGYNQGLNLRSSDQKYVVDNLRQKFATYERDNETGLDYAKARYYGSMAGRFTTVDPLQLSGSIFEPQVWNRYTYCVNNPLKYTDPLGLAHWTDDGHFVGDKNREYNADLDAHWNAKKQRWDSVNQGSPVTIRWSESIADSMILGEATQRHASLFEATARHTRTITDLVNRATRRHLSVAIPESFQPDIDQSNGNLFKRLLWINYYLRRHLNVDNLLYGGTGKDPRGGRGRFKRGADDLDQEEGIKKGMEPNDWPNFSDDKTNRRVQNGLDKVRNLQDSIEEYGDLPLEEDLPIDP